MAVMASYQISSATLQDILDKNNLLLIGTVSQNSTARDEEAKGEAGIAENEEKEVVVDDYHNVNAENASSFSKNLQVVSTSSPSIPQASALYGE